MPAVLLNSNESSMKATTHNILNAIPEHLPDELIETICRQGNIRIERILSQGHSTPLGQWYDQAWDEWILLLKGQARLSYHHTDQQIQLTAGDYLLIPAHTQHRVEWTPADTTTIWLAIHLQ
jgi:cupin 2 domain-containing protein